MGGRHKKPRGAFDELQREYVEAMRAIAPAIVEWWNDRCPYRWTDVVAPEAKTDFHRRWPAGPAGHPRILAVFREYFFRVEELNDRDANDGPRRPIDLLVNDLTTVAPDLFDIMQGLLFVPVGVDPDGEAC